MKDQRKREQSPLPAGQSGFYELLPWLLLVTGLVLFTSKVIIDGIAVYGGDYNKHWDAPRYALDGNPPQLGDLYLAFNYPTFVVALSSPLLLVDRETGESLWDMMNFILIGASICIIALGFKVGSREERADSALHRFLVEKWAFFVPAVFLLYHPLEFLVTSGNVDSWTLFFMSLFCYFNITEKHHKAGAVLAVLSLIKVVPVLLLIPAFVRKNWNQLGGFITTIIFYCYFGIIFRYFLWDLLYFLKVLPEIPIELKELSFSVPKAIVSELKSDIYTDAASYALWLRLWAFVTLILGVLLMRVVEKKEVQSVLYCFSLSWILLMIPMVQIIYLVWILPCFFWLLRDSLAGAIPRRSVLIFLFAWSLLFVGGNLRVIFRRDPWKLFESPTLFYAVLVSLFAISVLIGSLLMESRERVEENDT